ncbi:hypothetical protein N9D99_08985 [Gammaproteobacteria bacterium]|nr:hypothetical protein [Gammaproteobacteria bacterium]
MQRIKVSFDVWIQLVGMLSLVASLIFVGMELRQNQQVAKVTAYQALAEQIASYNALLLTHPEINLIRNAALNNESLSEKDEEQYRAFYRMLQRQSELAYLQFENGIIDEELLIRTTAPLRDHLRRSRYAKSYWDRHVESLSAGLSYVPKFEEYINSRLKAALG